MEIESPGPSPSREDVPSRTVFGLEESEEEYCWCCSSRFMVKGQGWDGVCCEWCHRPDLKWQLPEERLNSMSWEQIEEYINEGTKQS